MVPVVAKVALENKNTFIVAKLNSGNNPKTVQTYRLIGHPTYIIFQDGEVVGRFGGQMPEAELLRNILSVIDVEEN